MARSPNEKAEEAHKLYKTGMKLVDIASQLNVPAGSVRRWKSTYKWDGEQKNERSDKKANVRKEKKNDTEDSIITKVTTKLDNAEMSEKRRLFCLYYVKFRNKVKAYQKAYECSYENACGHASDLWKNVEVQRCINNMLNEYRSSVAIDIKDLFQWYLDIARADIGDYLSFGRVSVPQWKTVDGVDVEVIDPNTGEQKVNVYNTVDLKDSVDVDTSLISEVSEGKDGVKVKIADKIKAMQWLGEHIDLADEEQRAKIAVMKAKVQTDDEEEAADDGFLDALNVSAREDWSDEED